MEETFFQGALLSDAYTCESEPQCRVEDLEGSRYVDCDIDRAVGGVGTLRQLNPEKTFTLPRERVTGLNLMVGAYYGH